MQFSAKLTNADKVQLGIRSLGTRLPEVDHADVEQAMRRAARESVPYRGGGSYDIPERGYQRTGNLGRSVQVYTRGLTTVIEAQAYRAGREYTQYVIGDGKGSNQAWMHTGYWTTMKDAVDMNLDLLVKTMDNHNQEIIDQEIG